MLRILSDSVFLEGPQKFVSYCFLLKAAKHIGLSSRLL